MKKKFMKTISLVMSCVVCMSIGSLTVFAQDINSIGSAPDDYKIAGQESATDSTPGIAGYDDMQDKESVYQTMLVEEDTVPCDVYGTQAAGEDVYDPTNPNADENGFVSGVIEVLLPKTIILDGAAAEQNSGLYVVSAKGNIAGTAYIQVMPDQTFSLSSPGKADVIAGVKQNISRFCLSTSTVSAATDLSKTVTLDFADSVVSGNITAKLSAGQWHGVLNFTTQYVDTAA